MAKKTKEKESPKLCICKLPAVIVRNRGGKMITCPNPLKCPANLRTRWNRNEEAAIAEWNTLVAESAERRNHDHKEM